LCLFWWKLNWSNIHYNQLTWESNQGNYNCLQMEQTLWALDLCLQYSDHLAMYQLMEYVTLGRFEAKTHVFEVDIPDAENRPKRRRLAGQEEEVCIYLHYLLSLFKNWQFFKCVSDLNIFLQCNRDENKSFIPNHRLESKKNTLFLSKDNFTWLIWFPLSILNDIL